MPFPGCWLQIQARRHLAAISGTFWSATVLLGHLLMVKLNVSLETSFHGSARQRLPRKPGLTLTFGIHRMMFSSLTYCLIGFKEPDTNSGLCKPTRNPQAENWAWALDSHGQLCVVAGLLLLVVVLSLGVGSTVNLGSGTTQIWIWIPPYHKEVR